MTQTLFKVQDALESAKEDRGRRVNILDMDARLQFKDHQQQTGENDYIDISPSNYKWDLNDMMDGTTDKCSLYYDMFPLLGGALVMRKAEGGCAHVVIRDVEIDLDHFPYLTWNMIATGTPANLSVIVMDKEASVRGMSILRK